jgi:1-acyl-sn-glycerol-3-phosphate acyltransferase
MDFWYGYLTFIMGTYLRILGIRPEIIGLENIPKGPKIIVGNHPNATDSFHLPFLIKEKINALAEYDLLQVPFVGNWLRRADMIPVIPGRGRDALRAARDRLLRGNAVLIYPEAKLSNTHAVTHTGTGVARLAVDANVPIVPFGVYVPDQNVRVFHGHAKNGRETVGGWQFRGKTFFVFGKPFIAPAERAIIESHTFYRHFTDEIMQTVASLTEQAKSLINR